MMVFRNSKFRHIFGLAAKKDECYEGLRVSRMAHDPSICAVNLLFVAVAVESSGGGTFIVIPLKRKGRVGVGHPRVCGHTGPITDLKWDPFDLCVIASSSEDCTVKVWRLPPGGLYIDLSRYSYELIGHTKRVTHIEWHPTAKNILLSASADLKCIVWNVESSSIVRALSLHSDVVVSISWNYTGSLFATTCKDRRIRIIDPRKGTIVSEGEGHEGSKSSRVVFLRHQNLIFTTGFSRGSHRQIALWDVNDLSHPVTVEDTDSSSGILLPFFDPDTNVMYLAGKGDGNIRFYEIVPEPPYIIYLNEYQSSSPQCGLGVMPKWGVDPYKCELVRFYKLHTTKDLCEPISMIAPRKSERFQEDIFPPTAAPEPALSAKEWLQGLDKEPKKASMKDIGQILAKSYNESKNSNMEVAEDLTKERFQRLERNSSRPPDGSTMSDDEDSQSCFHRGMVKMNIGKFEQDYSRPTHDQTDSSTSSVTSRLPTTTTISTTTPAKVPDLGLKTSSYQLKLSVTNGRSADDNASSTTRPNDLVTDNSSDDRKRAPAVSSSRTVILRQMKTDRTLDSTDGHVVQMVTKEEPSPASFSSSWPYQMSHNGPYIPDNAASETKIKGQDSWSNQKGADTRIEMKNGMDRGREMKNETGSRIHVGPKVVRSSSDLSTRSKSLGSVYRKDNAREEEGEEEVFEERWNDEKIDFISTDAPDDTVIKPSILRTSMRSRRKERNITDSNLMFGRATSLREPKARQSITQLLLQDKNSSQDQKSVESSTVRNQVDLNEERRPGKLQSGSVTEQFLRGARGDVVKKPEVVEDDIRSKSDAQLNRLQSPQREGELSWNSVTTVSKSQLVPPNQGQKGHENRFPETERRDYVVVDDHPKPMESPSPRFGTASMERWKLRYGSFMGTSSTNEDGTESISNNVSDNINVRKDDLKTNEPKATAVTTSRSPATMKEEYTQKYPNKEEEKEKKDWTKRKDDFYNKPTDSFRIPESSVKTNSSKAETGIETRRRSGLNEESLPTDYDQLLSKYLEQSKEIRRLQEAVTSRDSTIQRLNKQLTLLLRQNISMPSIGAYK